MIFGKNNVEVPEISDEDFCEGFGANCDNDGLLKTTKNNLNGVFKRITTTLTDLVTTVSQIALDLLGLGETVSTLQDTVDNLSTPDPYEPDDFTMFLAPIIAGNDNGQALPVFDIASETLTFTAGTIVMNRNVPLPMVDLVVDLSSVNSVAKLVYIDPSDGSFVVRDPATPLTTAQIGSLVLIAAVRLDDTNESDLAITSGYRLAASPTLSEAQLTVETNAGDVMATATGYFEKVGDRVHFDVVFPNVDRSNVAFNNSIFVKGLPFPPLRQTALTLDYQSLDSANIGASGFNPVAIVFPVNPDQVSLFGYTPAGTRVSLLSQLIQNGGGTEIAVSGSYAIDPS